VWRTTDAARAACTYGQIMTTRTTTHSPVRGGTTLGRFPVRGTMQLGLFECTSDTDLRSVARLMADKTIHCVVVAGDRWGIVSDLDLMRALGPGFEELTAGDVAATDIVVVQPDDTIEHAAQLMAEHDTAHLIVASPEAGRPVGIVSSLDIARALAA
jgi:CBS domain-containing protein